MDIVVSLREKWGKNLFYPESKDAHFLAKFTGRPTLLKRQLKLAIEAGWKVSLKEKSIDLNECLKESPIKKKRLKND